MRDRDDRRTIPSMVGPRIRLRPLIGLVAALTIALGSASGAFAASSGWDGSYDLYRSGTFTTQKSWLWCTAAGVQIARNIVERDNDHSTSAQRRYFAWMRQQNRYELPLSAGVDPAGWAAGLRHFVDGRYRLVASRTFDGALRSAVQRMRATRLPVALTVSRGNHGWIMTGFSATADPAGTDSFKVTSVRVVGPLWGLQSRSYGYDMRPGKSLTVKQLRGFFTPWWYAPKRMVWDGLYVSIQPVPAQPQVAKSLPMTIPPPTPSAVPSATASPAAGGVAQVGRAASPVAPSQAAPIVPAPDGVPASPTNVEAGGAPAVQVLLLALVAILLLIAATWLGRARPRRRA
jgi:hypothetical protein